MKNNAYEIFNQFPQEIQNKVVDTLKAYDKVYVTREDGRWTACTACFVKAGYAPDYKAWIVNISDLYTDDEIIKIHADWSNFCIWWERLTAEQRMELIDKMDKGDEDADWKAFEESRKNK